MYPAIQAQRHPERPAFIMAGAGTATSYRDLDMRSNRLAHLLRAQGLRQRDHYCVFMENNGHYIVANAAGERSGLYYTCINSFLTAQELAYIVGNSDSRVLITSRAKRDVAAQAMALCPKVRLGLIVDAPSDGMFINLDEACEAYPDTPINDEWLGTPMLYSSGTTGRPKGVLRPLPDNPPREPLSLFHFLAKLWRYREDMVYLSPAPLYHSAPQAAVSLCVRSGGTAIIMEHFDPERKRSANPSFISPLKLRTSRLGNQPRRRDEHGSTADATLPGAGGGVSGLWPEGQRMGAGQRHAHARAGELVRACGALAGTA